MITLRLAVERDREFLFDLRNDPVVCRNSRRGPVTWEEHGCWWKYASEWVWVVEIKDGLGTHPIGYVRVSKGEGLVSIALVDHARGKGYGQVALRVLEPLVLAEGCDHLIAEIAPDNLPSQRAFLGAGWRPVLFEKWIGGR